MEADFFERLAESLGASVFTVQLPGRLVTYINPSVETLLGYTKEECLGKTTEHFYPNQKEYLRFGSLIKETIDQKLTVLKTEQLLKRKNGTIILTEISVSFIWVNGKVDQVISVVTDITERKMLQEATEKIKSQLRTMIDSYPAWVSCVDTEGNYFIANEYYTDTFKLPISQIEGHNFREFFPPDLYEKHKKLIKQVLKDGRQVEWEDQHNFDEDRITHINGIYTPLYDSKGSIWGISAFGLDVSKRKRIELEKEAIIDKLQSVSDEVKTLRGILPICSYCKNIRNDEGYYEQIEEYIHKHTGVDFSHTICKSCFEEHYPEDFESVALKKGKD